MATGSFPGMKRPGSWQWPPTPTNAEFWMVWSYTATSPLCLLGWPWNTCLRIHSIKKPFFPHASTTLVGQGLLIVEASRSRSDTPPHLVGLLWTSDQPIAETCTWQHTALTGDRLPCRRRDSNLHFREANGRKPTLKNARPVGWAKKKKSSYYSVIYRLRRHGTGNK